MCGFGKDRGCWLSNIWVILLKFASCLPFCLRKNTANVHYTKYGFCNVLTTAVLGRFTLVGLRPCVLVKG